MHNYREITYMTTVLNINKAQKEQRNHIPAFFFFFRPADFCVQITTKNIKTQKEMKEDFAKKHTHKK